LQEVGVTRLLIKNGTVIDPGRMHETADIFIEGGKILHIEKHAGSDGRDSSGDPHAEIPADRVIDATGLLVVPGLIDMHVHLREPGEEYKETIASGIQAAAAGGFTTICCMPNTRPVNDNRQVTEFIIHASQQQGMIRVLPVAAISRNLEGRELCEYGELAEAGAVAITDDGRPVVDSLLMRHALEYSRPIGLRVISHCEEPALGRGVMNEGPAATEKGLSGIPNAAESIMVMRDIALAELTGVPVHIAHVSTLESIRAIRDAKNRGIPVTAETAPHYFTLTDAHVIAYDTHAKMNPPLRSEKDREAVQEALADGTIDAIASDHAPHSRLEKEVPFDAAAFGIIGLETSLPLGLRLVSRKTLTISQLIEKMSINPARILGLPAGIVEGNAADLTLIDPKLSHVYSVENGYSKSRNSPFDGWEFTGKTVYTIAGGQVVFEI
jgi:dihydroorotase